VAGSDTYSPDYALSLSILAAAGIELTKWFGDFHPIG